MERQSKNYDWEENEASDGGGGRKGGGKGIYHEVLVGLEWVVNSDVGLTSVFQGWVRGLSGKCECPLNIPGNAGGVSVAA